MFGETPDPPDDAELKRLAHQVGESPRTTVILFVAQVNHWTARALAVGSSLSADRFEAVALTRDTASQQQLRRNWTALDVDVPLVVVATRAGEFLRPATQYVRSLRPASQHTIVVLIPELLVKHWYEKIFHNQSGSRLKAALLRIPWVVVINVPLQPDRYPQAKTVPASPT